MSERSETKRAAPPAIFLVAGLLAAIAGFATVYVSFAPSDNGRPEAAEDLGSAGFGGAKNDEGTAKGPLAGLSKGAMAPLLARPTPLDLPDIGVIEQAR